MLRSSTISIICIMLMNRIGLPPQYSVGQGITWKKRSEKLIDRRPLYPTQRPRSPITFAQSDQGWRIVLDQSAQFTSPLVTTSCCFSKAEENCSQVQLALRIRFQQVLKQQCIGYVCHEFVKGHPSISMDGFVADPAHPG